MEEYPNTLPERTVGDLLNETFSVYGKHFWKFVAMVAVIQAPMSLLALLAGENMAFIAVLAFISLIGTTLYYAAGVFSVGLHYVGGEISLARCYRRMWWQIVTLASLGIIIGLGFGLSVATIIFVIPTVVMLVFLIYWSSAIQVVIFEGYRPIAALKRSLELVRGSWWRVFGITLVYWLVALGLGIITFLPFLYLSSIALADGEQTRVSLAIQFAGGLLVSVIVWPALSIAFTLLYYDLRVRKENYDFAMLSQEMGIAPAQ